MNKQERRLEVCHSDSDCHLDGNRNYAGRYQLHGVRDPTKPPLFRGGFSFQRTKDKGQRTKVKG